MATWATADDVTALWPDADQLPAETVALLLDVAQGSCEAYAPALPVDGTPPPAWRAAVVMHASDVWDAARTSPEGTVGPGEYPITPRPLSPAVRQLLRPRRPRPRFGRPAVTP